MKLATCAVALAAFLSIGAPSLADPLVAGLRIKQVDRAFKAAAAASGVPVAIGGPKSCGPGEPGYFCSYDAGNALVVLAGAPSPEGEVDSLEVQGTDGRDSHALRTLVALMIDIVQPELAADRRRGIFHALVGAIPRGTATMRGAGVEFRFFDISGTGLVFNVQRPFE